jgi:hypothetical protein
MYSDLAQARAWNRPMLVFAGASAVLGVVAIVGMLVDHRMLGGAPVWAKPLKFAISGVLYGLTWAWLCSLVDRRQRTVRRASAVIVVLLGLELLLITGQVVRGRPSHFNVGTLFDATVYEIMATSIVVVWCGALVLTVLVLRSDIRDGARKLTVGLGAVISLVGVGLGALMTIPTGGQIAALEAGGNFHTLGAHTVGAPDGGPGLPLLGWSTTGGDLRIPHFVGMHGLQAMLLWYLVLGLLAARWSRFRLAAVRSSLVRIGAAGYAGLLVLLTWQAYRGQPITSPDGWTLAAFGVLVAGMAVAAAMALRRPVVSTVDNDVPEPVVAIPEPAGSAR